MDINLLEPISHIQTIIGWNPVKYLRQQNFMPQCNQTLYFLPQSSLSTPLFVFQCWSSYYSDLRSHPWNFGMILSSLALQCTILTSHPEHVRIVAFCVSYAIEYLVLVNLLFQCCHCLIQLQPSLPLLGQLPRHLQPLLRQVSLHLCSLYLGFCNLEKYLDFKL